MKLFTYPLAYYAKQRSRNWAFAGLWVVAHGDSTNGRDNSYSFSSDWSGPLLWAGGFPGSWVFVHGQMYSKQNNEYSSLWFVGAP
jgi:hypothetical protein